MILNKEYTNIFSKNPEISVIIPFHNRIDLLLNTLNSFENQISNSFEIILIDDGSDNFESSKFKEFKKFKLLYYKQDKLERANARNLGLSKSNCNYINYFDSDDIALPNHILATQQYIKKLSYPNVFHMSYQLYLSKEKNYIKHIYSGNLNNRILKSNILSCNGIVIKKEIALKNLFNTNILLSGSEDWELWLRLSKLYEIKGVPIITSTILNHDDRSEKKIDIKKIELRINSFISLVNNYPSNKFYLKDKKKINAELLLYLSLHYSLFSRYKLLSIKSLLMSISNSIMPFFRIRTIIIFKNILLK